ncbi:hypothetical protein EGW08_020827, partial [Elysia chlorotica]
MAAPIQRLAQMSYKFFSGQTRSNDLVTKETLHPLIHTLNEIKAEDLNFDPNEIIVRDKALIKVGRKVAPVSCMTVLQNSEFTLAVFVVKSGGSLPLHDHPHMFGLLKVISGSVQITSYTKVDPQSLPPDVEFTRSSPHIVTVKRNQDVVLAESDHCCFLSPSEGNFHEIKPLTDVAAFLDILAPPYNNTDRDCSYYKELPVQSPSPTQKDIRWLEEVGQPCSYWCDVIRYKGPSLNSKD